MDEKPTIAQICHKHARKLISEYNFKTVSGIKNDVIYRYKDGVYLSDGKNVIKVELEKDMGNECKTHIVNEVTNIIVRKTIVDREEMGCKDINLICLENGVFNLETKELLKHNSDYNFLNKLSVKYDKDAKCEKIIDFMSQVILEDDVEAIQEWLGYQLYRNYNIKKAVIFRGPPDTAKTTFLNIITKLIGENNISNKSLQLLAQGKWQIAKLYCKHANIGDDLTSEDVCNMGIIKQLTGRSYVDGEEKFGDSFGFMNYAKLMFACNKIPKIDGDVDDQAFWDRWMIFDFENVFEKNDGKTKINILSDITSDEELSGLLNWCISGLKRLQKKGCFSYRRDWKENRRIMQGEACSIAKFSNGCLKYKENNWISNSDIYNKYVDFCKLNNITAIETNQKFGKDLRKYCSFGKFNVHFAPKSAFGIKNIIIKNILPRIDV